MDYKIFILDAMDKLPKSPIAPGSGPWDDRDNVETLLVGKGQEGSKADIFSAKNEYESFQLVVVAGRNSLENVNVEVTDLKSQNGSSVIPKEMISLRRVGYVKTQVPRYATTYAGWWPDPLLDFTPVNISRGQKVHIWVTIYTPQNITAGKYKGKIRIIPENTAPAEVEIGLTVWNFTLPEETHLKNSFWLHAIWLEKYYGIKKELTPEFYERFGKFAGKYRLSPGLGDGVGDFLTIYLEADGVFTFDFTRLEPFIRTAAENGNSFNIGLDCNFHARFTDFTAIERKTGNKVQIRYKPLSEEHKKVSINFLRTICRWVKEKGWFDKAYIEALDEPVKSQFDTFNSFYALIKEAVPDLPRSVASGSRMGPEIADSVDTWCPLTWDYDKKMDFIASERKKGKKVWWYVCAGPLAEYCNFFIDMPGIKHRLLFWQTWKYKSDGLLYWGLNWWANNCPREFPVEEEEVWPNSVWNAATFVWNGFAHNGDGYFIYPGIGGRPIPSIRLEIVRDGLEDYEYFCILKEIVEKAKTKNISDKRLVADAESMLVIDDDVVKSTTAYTLESNRLQNERIRMGEIIEKLIRENA